MMKKCKCQRNQRSKILVRRILNQVSQEENQDQEEITPTRKLINLITEENFLITNRPINLLREAHLEADQRVNPAIKTATHKRNRRGAVYKRFMGKN